MPVASIKLVHNRPARPRSRVREWLAAFICIVAAAGLARSVRAGETLAGSGNNACESYLASDDDARLASDSWVLGFLSSSNLRAHNLDLLANQSNGIIIDALESYCETHPEALVADAAVELLKSLADSAGGECTGMAAEPPPRGKLSICFTAGVDDSAPEPAGFTGFIPGVE